MNVRPVRVEPVFDDPSILREFAAAHAPYVAPTSGYNDPPQASRLPWFKASWTPDSEIDGEAIFGNERLAAAASEAFGAEVVRPTKILVNVVGPMPALPPHLDPPSFRGADRWPEPPAGVAVSRFAGARTLVGLMGTSGLFEEWRLRWATGVCWDYSGPNGDYVFWPDGPDQPPVSEPPKENVALVGDNDTMFHGIGDVGRSDQYLEIGTITPISRLVTTDRGWAIVDGEEVRADYKEDDIRVSVVWKALCFADERAAAAFDDRTEDIALEAVVDIFSADLRKRGLDVASPEHPLTDLAWYRTLLRTYGFAKPEQAPVAEVGRA